MKKTIYLVVQIISSLVFLTGIILFALTTLDLMDDICLIIGAVLFVIGILLFIIISSKREKIQLSESGLTQEDYDFFYKSPSIYFKGAFLASIQAIKNEKKYKHNKILYENQQNDRVIYETKKYCPDVEKIPPSLKKLADSAQSFIDSIIV